MHWWDTVFADLLFPRLTFGFSTLTVYPDADPETATVDGYIARTTFNEIWSSITSSGTGTFLDSLGSIGYSCRIVASIGPNWDGLYRGIFLFDTSSIGVNFVASAVLSFCGYSKLDGLAATPDFNVYSSNPAGNTDIVNSDYGTFGSVAFSSSSISYDSFLIAEYNDFDLNGSGVAAVTTNGISKFGTRNANYDAAASAPPWVSEAISELVVYTADNTGIIRDPKLVVTYVGSKFDHLSPFFDAGSGMSVSN